MGTTFPDFHNRLCDRLCPDCRGLGWEATGRGVRSCVACGGSGWRNPEDTLAWLRQCLREWRAEHGQQRAPEHV